MSSVDFKEREKVIQEEGIKETFQLIEFLFSNAPLSGKSHRARRHLYATLIDSKFWDQIERNSEVDILRFRNDLFNTMLAMNDMPPVRKGSDEERYLRYLRRLRLKLNPPPPKKSKEEKDKEQRERAKKFRDEQLVLRGKK